MSSRPSNSVEVLLPDVVAGGAGPVRPGVDGGTAMGWNWVRGIGVALLTVVWAATAHYTSTGNESSGWGAALALTPMSVALALGLWRLPSRWLGALAGAAVLAGLVVSWPFLKGQVALLYYVEHLGVYLLLSVFFGRTLRGPDESLVTQMARRVHGGVLSPAQAAYTRQVTLAWCVFFAGMALISTLLFLFAPVAAWSLFANLLGGPLIALMFVGEYLWRRRALPEEKRATMADAVRAWKAQRSDKAP
ncbi:hypothetical protein [Hydrogenophaga taeniospiralis]|uniref:COG4648 family protein n=1 Tax=Hydrogenophaga taeniospiralis TaxID=65656 RepID=UPI001CFAAA21|nr:hypothetical protein [Hydrogenophaga taeniospiralis]MDP2022566.1 hypothetical protein [Hydrogenophaga sp.]UCU96229.1 hypothetical protein KI616_10480 [Hydrogenophaga taeniospiralis]